MSQNQEPLPLKLSLAALSIESYIRCYGSSDRSTADHAVEQLDKLRAALAAAQPAGPSLWRTPQQFKATEFFDGDCIIGTVDVYSTKNAAREDIPRTFSHTQLCIFGAREDGWEDRCDSGWEVTDLDRWAFEADVVAALLAAQPKAPRPTSDCPACGWQNDREGLDCEAAYEKATGRKLEPGDREFLTFRAGWIAGHTRAKASPSEQEPTESQFACRCRDDLTCPVHPDPADEWPDDAAPSPTPGEVEACLAYFENLLGPCTNGAARNMRTLRAALNSRDAIEAELMAVKAAYDELLRAALPAQGWQRDGDSERLVVTGQDIQFFWQKSPAGGWNLIVQRRAANVPTPPNAEPGERSGT